MIPNWIADDPEPQMIPSKTRNGMKFATGVEISISLSQADLETSDNWPHSHDKIVLLRDYPKSSDECIGIGFSWI